MSDLFNTTLAALAQPRKGIFAYEHNKYSDASRRRCQRYLIGAQKFTVCDSLIEHAVLASLCQPKSMLDMCELALPAFENMWIEWDEHKRMDLLIKHGTKMGYFAADYDWRKQEWAVDVGYHIGRDELGYYTYEQFALVEGKVAVPPMAFGMFNDREFDPLITPEHRVLNQQRPTTDERRLQQRIFGKILLGRAYVDKWPDQEAALNEIMYRCNPAISCSGNMRLPKSIDPSMQVKLAEKSAIMATGDLRFIIAVLALLNYPHTVVERKMEVGTSRIMWGKRVPRNEVKVLEIDLPKPRGTTRYERMFKGGGGKKRRHVRRGHWRRFRHSDGTVSTRWIGEQWVGSADVGTITHDYELKSKGAK